MLLRDIFDAKFAHVPTVPAITREWYDDWAKRISPNFLANQCRTAEGFVNAVNQYVPGGKAVIAAYLGSCTDQGTHFTMHAVTCYVGKKVLVAGECPYHGIKMLDEGTTCNTARVFRTILDAYGPEAKYSVISWVCFF